MAMLAGARGSCNAAIPGDPEAMLCYAFVWETWLGQYFCIHFHYIFLVFLVVAVGAEQISVTTTANSPLVFPECSIYCIVLRYFFFWGVAMAVQIKFFSKRLLIVQNGKISRAFWENKIAATRNSHHVLGPSALSGTGMIWQCQMQEEEEQIGRVAGRDSRERPSPCDSICQKGGSIMERGVLWPTKERGLTGGSGGRAGVEGQETALLSRIRCFLHSWDPMRLPQQSMGFLHSLSHLLKLGRRGMPTARTSSCLLFSYEFLALLSYFGILTSGLLFLMLNLSLVLFHTWESSTPVSPPLPPPLIPEKGKVTSSRHDY